MTISLRIYDTRTHTSVQATDGASITRHHTVVAEVSSGVESVKFDVDGKLARIESLAPFCLAGDVLSGTTRIPVAANLPLGRRVITATPFSQKFAAGTAGQAVTVTLNVLDENTAPRPQQGVGIYENVPDGVASALKSDQRLDVVRTWHVLDWTKPPTAQQFGLERRLKALGLESVPVVTFPENASAASCIPPSVAAAQDWFGAFGAAASGVLGAFEIINEPNLSKYNALPLEHLTRLVIQPASCMCRRTGILLGSPSWSGPITDKFVDWWPSIRSLVDFACYHPYGSTLAAHEANLRTFRTVVGPSIPLWLTEWQIHGRETYGDAWPDQIPEMHRIASKYAQVLIYFRAVVGPASTGGPANASGLLTRDTYQPTRFHAKLKEVFG